MMKTLLRGIMVLSLMFASFSKAFAEDKPMDVKYGIFITSIYDINFAKNQYDVNFWTWFHHNDAEFHPNKTIEIVKAKQFSRHNSAEEIVNGIRWDTAKVKARIDQEWAIESFPFDTQVLKIIIEDSNLDEESLNFIPDTKASRIDPDAIPNGWELQKFELTKNTHSYHTAFGDPSAKSDVRQDYSQVVAEIHLKRDGWRLFLTLFLGFFVATILLTIVFIITSIPKAISIIPQQPRITLIVGALFSAVGSVYGISAKLPYTTSFTLADSLEVTTFLGVAMATVSSISSDVLKKNGQLDQAVMFNRIMAAIFIFLSFGVNGYLIATA